MNKVHEIFNGRGNSIAYAIISVIFIVVSEDWLKTITVNSKWSETTNYMIVRLLICFAVFILGNVGYGIYRKIRRRVIINRNNYSIQVEYGDLLKVTDGKVVIDFDECFTTKVGEEPSDIKPLSVCGQYLSKHPIDDMHRLIEIAGVQPERRKSKYNNQDCYKPGTIVPNGNYLLMAFSKLDQNGLGQLTYNEFVDCLDKLWSQIDLWHGTNDVYLPILGSHITRVDNDLTQQELLDIMISSYLISPKKMKKPCKLHIMCKEREGFSLNKIFGVE